MESLRNRSHESTDLADVDPEGVRNLEQTLLEEGSSTMGNHAITFHLSETETTITSTTLDGLARHNLDRTARPSVNLVVYHMAETLVVSGSEEDLRAELFARVAVEHDFKASRLVALLAQELGDDIYRDVGERSGITFEALERSYFG